MDSKNPMEKMREAIIKARSLGDKDVFTQKEIAGEILQISDAFDKFYNIKRTSETKSPTSSLSSDETIKDLFFQTFHDETEPDPFRGTIKLLKEVNEPLKIIKKKLCSDDDNFYLSLSSMIVSVAIRSVVFRINSYKPPKSYDLHRFDLDGVDKVYRNLIHGALDVFFNLKNFDMDGQTKMDYDKNNNTLISIEKSINPITIRANRREEKKSSGCMILVVAITTSLLVCTLGLVLILI